VTLLEDQFKSAVVVGTIRNGAHSVKNDLQRILNALNEILPTCAFVVESDSTDNTVGELNSLSNLDTRIAYKSLGKVAPVIPDRINRLRFCRNAYVEEIRTNHKYRNCDLVVVADLDGINTEISARNITLALETSVNWDALTANQRAKYYDILALRHIYWSPNNWSSEAAWFEVFLGKEKALQHTMIDRMLKIPVNYPPMEVQSAFGGFAIYKRWVFDSCDYSEDSTSDTDEIDHVSLSRKIRSHGGHVYIHPALINANWTEHSISSIRSLRILKKFVRLVGLKPIINSVSTALKKLQS
jgi:hypothetical protein